MALDSGKTTVAAAGTAVPLSSESQRVDSLLITPLPTNTKTVFVGGRQTSHTAKIGVPLAPSAAPIEFTSRLDHVDDLLQVYVDAEVNGEGVSYSYGHLP